MNKENKKILDILAKYLEKYEDIRFGQALANLDINISEHTPGGTPVLKDIYYNSNKEILFRVQNSLQP